MASHIAMYKYSRLSISRTRIFCLIFKCVLDKLLFERLNILNLNKPISFPLGLIQTQVVQDKAMNDLNVTSANL